jgi:type VI secretion system secreted protein VgrG
MRNLSKGLSRFLVLFVAAALAAFLCPSPVSATSILGSAQQFAILAGSTVTNTGPTAITGDVGVSPGTAVTGFPPGSVTGGTIYSAGAVALLAQSDLTTAYNGLAAMPVTIDLTGDNLGGLTLTPGVYHFDSSAQLTGTLILNAQGNNNAHWVFQIGSTLTTASNSLVEVTDLGSNGGKDDGVFWQVGSSATLGTNTTFEGNILADQSITLTTGATIPNGRALAQIGAVTMDTNTVSIVCPNGGPGYSGSLVYDRSGHIVPVPEPLTLVFLGSGLAGLVSMRKRFRKQPPLNRGVRAEPEAARPE